MFQLTTYQKTDKKSDLESITYARPEFNHATFNENNTATISIIDIFDILNRRKYLLISSILLVLLIASIYSFTQIPSYQAQAIIQIEREHTQIVEFGQIKKPTEVFQSQEDPFLKTRYAMLKSKVIAQKVINTLDLGESLTSGNSKKLDLAQKLKVLFKVENNATDNSTLQTTPTPSDPTQLFLERLSVLPIIGTHLIDIKFEGKTPKQAQLVVETLINEFIKFQIETSNNSAEYAKEFLTKQLVKSAERLQTAEIKLNEYANENGILKVNNNQSHYLKKLERLDDALVKAEIKRINAESIYNEVLRTKSTQYVLSNPLILNLKEKQLLAELDYQSLQKKVRAKNPKLKALKRKVDDINIKINTETLKIKDALKSEYIVAKNQESKIRGQLSLLKVDLHNLQNKNLTYSALDREVKSSENLYKNILQRLEEVNVASAVSMSSINVLEPPILPIDKYRPNHKVNLLLGAFAGFILGLCLVFLREALDKNYKTHTELEAKTGLPVLGRIPQSKHHVNQELDMIVSQNPDDPISEAYRILSANIQLITSRLNKRIVLITSPHSGEGKSVTASNVACAYAKMGKKVLLIDADIRKPSLHRRFSLDNNKGLSNYLKGETNFSGITQHIKKIGGLFIITGGENHNDPVSLLSNGNMEHLTEQGAKYFDYVIIDAPPVIGFADTLLLTSFATATLIVSRHQNLEAQELQLVINKLSLIKLNLIGYLLVNVKNPEAQNTFYSNYKNAPNVIPLRAS